MIRANRIRREPRQSFPSSSSSLAPLPELRHSDVSLVDRSAVEREFGRLKHHYGLAMLRVRGIERVRLHADLTMLARLTLALARARTVEPAA